MLSREQIEQIVKMTIDTLNTQESADSSSSSIRYSGPVGGWMFEDANDCVEAACRAQKKLMELTMDQRAQLIEAMRQAARDNAPRLAQMAHEETGYGNVPDKIAKILLVANKTPGTEDIVPQVYRSEERREMLLYSIHILQRQNALRRLRGS